MQEEPFTCFFSDLFLWPSWCLLLFLQFFFLFLSFLFFSLIEDLIAFLSARKSSFDRACICTNKLSITWFDSVFTVVSDTISTSTASVLAVAC
ncbi:MAG TPA: hypothetical protein EYP92_02010 [Candidatus Thioglobus sp.]|nr:hypothetical protein [Candidatus Thioglobus sp.]HIL42472.1 hypothetical protein [Gammaproteobacteria bacterium]